MDGLVAVMGGVAAALVAIEKSEFDESRYIHIKSAIPRSIAAKECEKGNGMMSTKERLELVLSIRDTSVGGGPPNARERRPTSRNDAEDGVRRRRVCTLGKVELG